MPAPGLASRRGTLTPGHRARIITVAPGSTVGIWAEAESRSSPRLRGTSHETSRLLEIYASLVWASADLALPDSGYSVG